MSHLTDRSARTGAGGPPSVVPWAASPSTAPAGTISPADRFTLDDHRIPAVTIPAKVRHTPLRCVAAGAPRLELRAHAEHPPTCLGPDPPVSGTAGSSAAGLSPLRPGALGSQTPTRRCAEAATGSGSVGCRRTGSVRRRPGPNIREPPRHRHPSAQHRAPRSKRSGGRSARTTPPARRPDTTKPAPDRSPRGTPVRPPRGSLVRPNHAAHDRSAPDTREAGVAILNSLRTTTTNPVPPPRQDLRALHPPTGRMTDASPGSGPTPSSPGHHRCVLHMVPGLSLSLSSPVEARCWATDRRARLLSLLTLMSIRNAWSSVTLNRSIRMPLA